MKKLFIIILVLYLSAISIWCKDREEIRVNIRYKIADTTHTIGTDNPRWPDGVLNQRIDNAQDFICGYTHALHGEYLISAVTGQMEYGLPSGHITIDRVAFMHTSSTEGYKKLTQVSKPGLDRDAITWEIRTAGYPRYYYIAGSTIGFVPKPAGGYCHPNSIKLEYYKKPPALTSDSDIPYNGLYNLYIWHDLIEYKVASECLEDENKLDQAKHLWDKFVALLGMMKTEVKWNPDKPSTKIKIRYQ